MSARPAAGSRLPRRSAGSPRGLRAPVLAAAIAPFLALAGCSSADPVQPSSIPHELEAELVGVEEPPSPQDDYWTETLGDYLRPEELHAYWVLPERRRLRVFGSRWLEACLREDLLEQHRWELSREERGRYQSAEDYDAGREALNDILEKRPP